MRGIKIVCVGRIKESYFTDGIAAYAKEINKKYPFAIIECQDEPTPDGASAAIENQIRRIEGERILSKIADDDYVIALCIDGKGYSTDQWKRYLARTMPGIRGSLVLVIGGSLGLAPEVVKRANEKLSFSAMTFPHQLMRMILCEQLAKIL